MSTSESPHRDSLPLYADLPRAPDGGRSGWGIFGEGDNVGLLNLQTPERIVEAARLIRRGVLFPLNAPHDAFMPPIAPSRTAPRHTVLHAPEALGFDDVYDNFYPQGSSQWDSLGHVGYTPNVYYNGASESDVWSGRRNTIEHWATRGIAGRAVLLDMVRGSRADGVEYDPGSAHGFSVQDLERARQRAGVSYAAGDILIIHTGFAAWYVALSQADRLEFVANPTIVGLAPSEEMCEYLWDSQLAGVATDSFAVEIVPIDRSTPLTFIHRMLLGQFGMALGELWWTENLAEDCAVDGVCEMFLSSAPLNLPGALGSPPNALAIK